MFHDDEICGNPLPRGVLSLTYDDGPGLQTIEIGELLAAHGIGATFFVLGKNVQGRGATIAHLRSLGHLIGNHTFEHPRLPELTSSGGDATLELLRTHDLISDPHVSEAMLFRAPHGAWKNEDEPCSPVARALNECQRLSGYVGPIGWDIDGADWRYWLEGRSVADCAGRYLSEITAAGSGIVLLHDGSEVEELSRVNQTFRADTGADRGALGSGFPLRAARRATPSPDRPWRPPVVRAVLTKSSGSPRS